MKKTEPYILRIPLSSNVLKEQHKQFFRKIRRYMAKYQRLIHNKNEVRKGRNQKA